MSEEPSDELVTVATFARPELAHLMRGLLETEGIEAHVDGEIIRSLAGVAGTFFDEIHLQVRDCDAEKALEILDQQPNIPPDEDGAPEK